MEELAYHKLKDGSTIAIFHREREGKYVVGKYSKSDIEEWSVEYVNEDEAWREFRKASEEA